MTRHIAESILLSKNTPDGTYLLRPSSTSDFIWTLSVRLVQLVVDDAYFVERSYSDCYTVFKFHLQQLVALFSLLFLNASK